jgi:hypothetical protein
MVADLAKKGILVIRQPSNSPESNLCDLALFNSLKSYMRSRSNEMPTSTRNNKGYIQSIMWNMMKNVVNFFEPRKLFNTSLQRQVLFGLTREWGAARSGEALPNPGVMGNWKASTSATSPASVGLSRVLTQK